MIANANTGLLSLFVFLWAGWLGGYAAAQAPRLVAYQFHINFGDASRAFVSVQIKMDHVSSARFALVRYEGTSVELITAQDDKGNLLPLDVKDEAGGTSISSPRPDSMDTPASSFEFEINYIVSSTSGDLGRIPIPVPDPPTTPGTRPVDLRVSLAEGQIPVGDQFPSLAWKGGEGQTTLANVPSVLIVHGKSPSAITLADRILNTTALCYIAMFAFLGGGSLLWWTARRRRRP